MPRDKGDYDAAISNFALASQKGPHFADPLEMWGKALPAKKWHDENWPIRGRREMPAHWCPLHLKWARRWLIWARRAKQRQFALAAGAIALLRTMRMGDYGSTGSSFPIIVT